VPSVFRVRNGSVIKLAPGTPELVDEVESGYVVLDGKRQLGLKSNTLSERRRMMENGAVCVTIPLKAGQAQEPVIQAFGILCSDNDLELKSQLYGLIKDETRGWSPKTEARSEALEEELRLAILRLFRHETGKRPLISVRITGI